MKHEVPGFLVHRASAFPKRPVLAFPLVSVILPPDHLARTHELPFLESHSCTSEYLL